MRTASSGQRFFLSSLYSSPEGKTGDKSTETMEKGGFGAAAVVVLLAAVGVAFSLHTVQESYEAVHR